jgi:hypothetical protein
MFAFDKIGGQITLSVERQPQVVEGLIPTSRLVELMIDRQRDGFEGGES